MEYEQITYTYLIKAGVFWCENDLRTTAKYKSTMRVGEIDVWFKIVLEYVVVVTGILLSRVPISSRTLLNQVIK